jgi:hypothetical protein
MWVWHCVIFVLIICFCVGAKKATIFINNLYLGLWQLPQNAGGGGAGGRMQPNYNLRAVQTDFCALLRKKILKILKC